MSQDLVVERAGGVLKGRHYMSKIETGVNQVSSARLRNALAQAFGVGREDFSAYLDDEIDIEELLRRKDAPRSTPQPTVDAEDLPPELDVVLRSAEGKAWSRSTLGALRGSWTFSRERRTEEQWLTLGRAYEMGHMAAGRVVTHDPVEERRARKGAR